VPESEEGDGEDGASEEGARLRAGV
jgi:hypothetical protein